MKTPQPRSLSASISPSPGEDLLASSATLRQALLQEYQPRDPEEWIRIELVVQAYEDFQRLQGERLDPRGGLIVLDIEGKIKRRAALHLSDMLLGLRDARQRIVPRVHIAQAQPVQLTVLPPGSAEKSAGI